MILLHYSKEKDLWRKWYDQFRQQLIASLRHTMEEKTTDVYRQFIRNLLEVEDIFRLFLRTTSNEEKVYFVFEWIFDHRMFHFRHFKMNSNLIWNILLTAMNIFLNIFPCSFMIKRRKIFLIV